MLKVLKVATFLSVACVTGASAAPAVKGLDRARPAAAATVELVSGRKCHSRACTTSRRKASRREATYRDRRRSRKVQRSSIKRRAFVRSASSGVSRSCLTAPARSLLSRIESRFGSVQVISTCRPGARIAGTGRISRHASGNAVDFDAGGRKAQIVSWLIANHKSGGTMTYPAMSHIHVDIGPHFVSLAGSRRHASSSSRRNNATRRVAESQTQRKRVSIRRGPSVAHFDPDGDD